MSENNMYKKLRFRAFVLGVLYVACGYAVSAPVCYNPANQTIPGVTLTASGTCNVTAVSSIDPPIPGYSPPGLALRGNNESCTLTFSTPVKNLTVDIGAHSCDANQDAVITCQTAVFNVNGAHRPIASGELHTPTDYSFLTGQGGLDPVSPLSLDANGDVVGGNDDIAYNDNGSGQVQLPPAFAVRSVQITNTTSYGDPDNTSWFNVCYDGLAPPTVTVNKVSKGGTGSFSFKGTSNANGFTTTEGAYTITTATAGVVASGSLVNLSAANTVTEIQETVPPGWALTGASCVDTNAAVSGNIGSTFGVLTGNTLQIPAAVVLAGANLHCTFTNTYTGLALSGKVILDTGVGTGVAHDATQNGTEPGQPGVILSLTDCGNTVYSTTTTAGDGSFSLSLNGVPAGQACVVEALPAGYSAVSANVGTTGGSYTAATASLKFTVGATAYSGIVLGNVPMSTWTVDGSQQIAAGQAVAYAHTYVAGTAGTVTFSTTDSPAPTGLVWTSTLYQDTNCNGVLDAADTLLTGPVTVTSGQKVCVLNRVMTPAGARNGALDLTTVNAKEDWTVVSPAGSLSQTLKNVDTTMVGGSGLTLLKEVRKIDSCPADANASLNNATAYSFSGSAKPGDWLEYRLRFTNSTPAALTSIVIHDQVPVYTRYKSALCLITPGVGISGCSVTQAPADGASTGAIVWTLPDATAAPVGLQPLASGSVSFCVQVQQ